MPIPPSSFLPMSSVGQGWLVLGGLAIAAVATSVACSGKDLEPGYDAVAAALLADVGPRVVEPALERFVVTLDALDGALVAWAATSGESGEATARTDAQLAWADAMAAWQELEMLQLGPAASSLTAVAGEDFRDEIYSWPTVNPCRVDQETVEEDWNQPDFFTSNLVNSYGLDALEHLLFSGDDNACPGQVDINTEGTWDALTAEGIDANRAAFSEALVAHILEVNTALLSDWETQFTDTLASASDGNAVYDSAQDGLNAVYDALFYLETQTKDRKLAKPLGLVDCAEDTCPNDVEGQVGGDSVSRIEANLIGFRTLFSGGEGIGIDDLLDEVGHGDLAEQILTDTDAAIALAEALQGPLDQLIEEDAASVIALYDAVKRITDALKGDLPTVLTLQIPTEAAGDAD